MTEIPEHIARIARSKANTYYRVYCMATGCCGAEDLEQVILLALWKHDMLSDDTPAALVYKQADWACIAELERLKIKGARKIETVEYKEDINYYDN